MIKRYDEAGLLETRGAFQHDDANYGLQRVLRGNLTSQDSLLTPGVYAASSYVYDTLGNVQSFTDSLHNKTTYLYQDNFYGSNCVPSTASYAYRTTVTDAKGHQTNSAYYACTGALQSLTDSNRQSKSYTYDFIGRLLSSTLPNGGGQTITYNDAAPVSIRTSSLLSPSVAKVATTTFDGIGEAVKLETIVPGNTVEIDSAFDGLNRETSRTLPYFEGSTPSTITKTYDALNRKLTEVQADGSAKTWKYQGNTASAIDEAGVVVTSTTDAAGRLVRVVEPGQRATTYTYDSIDNLLSAIQAGTTGESPRSRSFTYDLDSRLTTSTNPETGTICYGTWSGGAVGSGSCQNGYDANGNLVAKTDARGKTVSYTYDGLNRLMFKRFADGTPIAAFGYDGNDEHGTPLNSLGVQSTGAIGRLSFVSDQFSAASASSYDVMGRVSLQLNFLPSTRDFKSATSALYDLGGNLTDLSFPSGRHLRNTFDIAGRPTTSQLVDINGVSQSQSYLQGVTYLADGSPQILTLGNGVQETIVRNNRLQVQSMSIASPLPPFNGATFASKTYCYTGCTTGGTANNGNIWGVTDTQNASQTQGFTYDLLNRIGSFTLNGALNQQYAIDSFGNLSGMSGGKAITRFDASTNRANNMPCAYSVAAYDASGNQLCDTDPNGMVRQYTYDAENRISQINAVNSSTPFETYVYGADGARVRKTDAAGNYTEYINFNGQPIAEKTADGWTDYIYGSSGKVARVEPYDVRAHLSGTRVDGSQTGVWGVYVLPLASQSVPVMTGDMLSFRMYQQNARGAISITFSDGSNSDGNCGEDQRGDCLHGESLSNQWVNRTSNIGVFANGKTISSIFLENTQGAPQGTFDVMLADMAITRADGTVIPLLGRTTFQSLTGPLYACNQAGSSSDWPTNCATEKVTSTTDFAGFPSTTIFSLGDHLGTAQMEFTSGGWPVWQGQFAPFGGEISPQQTTNHYKFTGKERDTESGLDYFGARYYASSMGRWMSPDWSAKEEPVPYAKLDNPQSLNLYGYVLNNPLSQADPDGHCCWDDIAGAVAGVLNIVPQTANLINSAGNAALSLTSTSYRIPMMDEIQPDAHASAGGMAVGQAAQLMVPVGDLAEGAQITRNAMQGAAGEAKVGAELVSEGKTVVGSQVGVQTDKGLRVVDHMVQDGGKLSAVEVKTGGATRNAFQLAKDASMESNGGKIVGKNAPANLRGQTVKMPTEVRKPQP